MQYPFPWQIRQQRRTEGVWRRQSRDAMTNSGRRREEREKRRGTNEGGFLSLQIQGKWTDKEPNTAVSAFFPIVVVHAVVVVFFFFPLSTSLVSNGIKWSPCPRRSPRRYWGRKASLGRWARHDKESAWQSSSRSRFLKYS